MKKKKNPHLGSTFESFLKEEGIFDEVRAGAMKQIIAQRILAEMEKKHITQTDLAKLMKTSRAAIKRLLDPKNVSVTLLTLNKAAAALGREIEIKIK
ncbi:MAG: XRE family transcriptional regulator [Candidatus Babeliales bacterium]